MRSPSTLRKLLLAPCLILSAALPAHADCIDTMQSCTSSCESSLTSGAVLGIVGALKGNSAAYQQGQRQLQQVEACTSRCTTQYDSCSQAEESKRGQEEAARLAQQQRADAQRRAEQQRVQADQQSSAQQEKLRQSVNRVVSPPVLPALTIKDATPLLQQALAHEKNGNPAAAAYIYMMVIKGGTQPKHQQAARAGLKAHAIEDLASNGVLQPGAYSRSLAEYGPLGVFTVSELAQLGAMAPEGTGAEDASRDYLRKQPNGGLRPVAQGLVQGLPQLRVREEAIQRRIAEERSQQQRLKVQEAESDRLKKAKASELDEMAKRLPYDSVSDYESASRWGQGYLFLVVRKNLPVRTLGEFVEYMRNPPLKPFGTNGVGRPSHQALQSLASQAGFRDLHVPYRTMEDCLKDLEAGDIDAVFADPSSSLELIRTDRVRVLAKTR